MQLGKRGIAALALVGSAFPLSALASNGEAAYPQRPVTLVIGYPPGGEADALARLLSTHMADDLGHRMIVDYRPDAAGNIAAETVARVLPDGYTLYLAARPNTIHKMLYGHLKYDFSKDLVPIGLVATIPHVIVAGKHAAINTSRHDSLDENIPRNIELRIHWRRDDLPFAMRTAATGSRHRHASCAVLG